jgi:hypothetical protein
MIALLGKIPVSRWRLFRPYLIGQQAVNQIQRQPARLAPDLGIEILKHHVVQARLAVNRPRTAERDVRTGNILQFDRDVLHDMPEPGALVLVQTAHEATGFAIGTAMLMQPRQGIEQGIDKRLPQFAGGPVFELLEIEHMPDHREVRINIRTNVNVAVDDFHRDDSDVILVRPLLRLLLSWTRSRSSRRK